MSGAGDRALTKSINLESRAVFLPGSSEGWGLGVLCSRAQLPYAINRRSFHRYGPRNEEISVAPVKKSSVPSLSLFLSFCHSRWPSSFFRRATFCPAKTVWINISAHLKVQWASGPCLSAFRLLFLAYISSYRRLFWLNVVLIVIAISAEICLCTESLASAWITYSNKKNNMTLVHIEKLLRYSNKKKHSILT